MKYSLLYGCLPFLLLAEASNDAHAQGAGVIQGTTVVPGNFASWQSNGILKDSGVSSITLNFPSIASGDVIGNASGSLAVAGDTTFTHMIDTLTNCATQGSVLYRASASWTCLLPGTSGQLLESLGSAANPVWETVTVPSYSAGTGLNLSGTTFSLITPAAVTSGGTGLTSGTSGGVLYYSASNVLASSALLTQYAVLLGGGSAAAPTALASLGSSGQALLSNGGAAAPSFQTIPSGTVTQVNTGSCLTGGPITATGTVSAVAAASGVCGSVTPDTNSAHYLSGIGTWTVPAGTTPAPLIGTTGSIFGSTIAPTSCAVSTLAITSATTAEAVTVTPAVYPGDGFVWEGYVSTAGTVSVKLCNFTGSSLAPTGASLYNIRVIP